MRLIGPDPLGHALQGQRQRCAGIGPQLADMGEAVRPAGHEARAQPRQVGALGERMENHHPFGIGTDLLRDLQRTFRAARSR